MVCKIFVVLPSPPRGLRSIGAPGLIGYDRRPVFTYPRCTRHMLEHVIVRAKITNSGWGNVIIHDNKLVEAMLCDNEYDKVT